MTDKERFRSEVEVVESFIRRRDYFNAHSRLLGAVGEYLEAAYPVTVSPAEHGLSIAHNGRLAAVVDVVVHGVIRDRTKLEDLQRSEISAVLKRLTASGARLKILVVRNVSIKAAIVSELSESLNGTEVWTVDDMLRVPLPLRT